jgi:hypothetical protein
VAEFRVCSVLDIIFRFPCAKADLKYSCTAGTYCLLLINLDALLARTDQSRRR